MDENPSDVSSTNGGPTDRERWARWARPAAVGAAGLLAGGLLAGTLTASADDSTTSDSSTAPTAPAQPGAGTDPPKSQRSDEELLTGSTADKVEAAVLAEYPGATIVRIETDSDGVYEAHITTADGEQFAVEVDKDFAVTGKEAHGGPGGHGGPGSPDPATAEEGATGTSLAT